MFESITKLMNEAVDKVLSEAENYSSVVPQDGNKDTSDYNTNSMLDNIPEENEDKQEEKAELKAQAIDKIQQSLKVTDELQTILNNIKKLNNEEDSNKWKVNEEDNTARLRSKNAYIFKQNANLCLSHDNKIEIFKSVKELHDWLKQNNYPLPENIQLHESSVKDHPYVLLGNICKNSDENSWIQKKALQLANGFENGDIDWATFYNRLKDLVIINDFKVDEILKEDEEARNMSKEMDVASNYKDEPSEEDLKRKKEIEKNKDTVAGRLKLTYERSPWGEILKHRWEGLGDEVNAPSNDEIKKQFNWNKYGSSWRKMDQETDKAARREAGVAIKNTGNPMLGNKPDDLNAYFGNLRRKYTSTHTDPVYTKKESNQLDDESLWYLEYQTPGTDKAYLNNVWREADLICDNLDNAAKFASREDAMDELRELYLLKSTEFPFKPINLSEMEECGVTCGGLGSAVTWFGNKKKEESTLDEDNRREGYAAAKTDRDVVKNAKVKDFGGNIIGYYGPSPKEVMDKAEEDFKVLKPGDKARDEYIAKEKAKKGYSPLDANLNRTINANAEKAAEEAEKNFWNKQFFKPSIEGKAVYTKNGRMVPENAYIVYDATTNEPIGVSRHDGKKIVSINNPRMLIGVADIDTSAYELGVDSDEAIKNRLSANHDKISTKANAQFHGLPNNKLSIFNKTSGKLANKYAGLPYPEVMHQMFGGIWDDSGKVIVSPEEFKKRVEEVNTAFGRNFTADDTLYGANKKNNPNYPEYTKWKDEIFTPYYNASKTANKTTQSIVNDRNSFDTGKSEYQSTEAGTAQARQEIEKLFTGFNDGSVDLDTIYDKIDSIVANDSYSDSQKRNLISGTYSMLHEYDPDTSKGFARAYRDFLAPIKKESSVEELTNEYLKKINGTDDDSLLTEDDTPADFADGPTNIASDIDAATSTTDTTASDETVTDGLDDYGPADDAGGTSPANFGDININSGGDIDPEAEQMPTPENKRIIDVLANDKDNSDIKVKVKDTDTGKVEEKNLNEIDV